MSSPSCNAAVFTTWCWLQPFPLRALLPCIVCRLRVQLLGVCGQAASVLLLLWFLAVYTSTSLQVRALLIRRQAYDLPGHSHNHPVLTSFPMPVSC